MTLINVNVSSMVVPHMDEYTSGASNSFYVKFTFSPEWDDLTKLVSFKAGSTIVSQIMSGDTIAIPHEVLKPCTSLYIGVLGTQGETVVLPTIWKELRKVKYGTEEGTFPVDPTPSQYQQILNIAQSVRDDADNGVFDGDDGISIVNVTIRGGHLICTLSDGTELDAGELPGGSGGTSDHRELNHRDAEGSHPISAITGLSSALDSYRTASAQDLIDGQLQNRIEGKVNKTGDSVSSTSDISYEFTNTSTGGRYLFETFPGGSRVGAGVEPTETEPNMLQMAFLGNYLHQSTQMRIDHNAYFNDVLYHSSIAEIASGVGITSSKETYDGLGSYMTQSSESLDNYGIRRFFFFGSQASQSVFSLTVDDSGVNVQTSNTMSLNGDHFLLYNGSGNEYIPDQASSIANKGYVDSALAGKQNTLTAGAGISIVNGVISCTFPNGDTEEY